MDQVSKAALKRAILWFALVVPTTMVISSIRVHLTLAEVAGWLVGGVFGAVLYFLWIRRALRKAASRP